MACVLRVYGRDLDVDRLIELMDVQVGASWRRGEPRGRKDHEPCEHSGFNLCISAAGFHEFEKQVEEAIESLREDADLYEIFARFPGVESMTLDFGDRWPDESTVVAHSDSFPADLIRRAGSFGFAIEISHYSISDDGDPKQSPPR